uniref:C2H2-type domain-containing protein n=1 Tax=Homalodisca liturata TaxID=320908 RepID=A0A1B6HXB1_9HEMI
MSGPMLPGALVNEALMETQTEYQQSMSMYGQEWVSQPMYESSIDESVKDEHSTDGSSGDRSSDVHMMTESSQDENSGEERTKSGDSSDKDSNASSVEHMVIGSPVGEQKIDRVSDELPTSDDCRGIEVSDDSSWDMQSRDEHSADDRLTDDRFADVFDSEQVIAEQSSDDTSVDESVRGQESYVRVSDSEQVIAEQSSDDTSVDQSVRGQESYGSRQESSVRGREMSVRGRLRSHYGVSRRRVFLHTIRACGKCSRRFYGRDAFTRHMNHECITLPKLKCPYCPFKTNYTHIVRGHVLNSHADEDDCEEILSTLAGGYNSS